MSSDLDAVRKGLEGHLPSAKNLSDEYIGILDKYLLTEPLALAEADVDFLTCQNVPVPLLTLNRAYKTPGVAASLINCSTCLNIKRSKGLLSRYIYR
jgi:hypothetical protein